MNNGSKIDAATPGLSLTPTSVTFESFFVNDTPRIILFLDIFFLFVIKEPETFCVAQKTAEGQRSGPAARRQGNQRPSGCIHTTDPGP